MNEYTTLTIKIDKKLKRELQRMAKEMGISVTTIVIALLKQFVRDGGITLSINTTSRRGGYAAMAKAEARKKETSE